MNGMERGIILFLVIVVLAVFNSILRATLPQETSLAITIFILIMQLALFASAVFYVCREIICPS